jgi:hypothetical protein
MTIKPAISFITNDSDKEFSVDVGTIIVCMTNNPNYKDPSPTLPVVTAGWNGYNSALNAAADGGSSLIAAKNESRAALGNIIRNLAAYVQANCQNSLSILLSSGFRNQKTERQPIGPLVGPDYVTLSLGINSGELVASVAPVFGVSIYNWQIVAANAPTVVLQTIQSTKTNVMFTGLTPGVAYIVSVNAVGTAGPTDFIQSNPQFVV